MDTTTNMGLVVWDLESDDFDHSTLATNFEDIDDHDHTTNKGVQIPSGGLANGAVTGTKIAANAITPTTHIPSASIPQSRLANNSVGTAQIIDGSVGTGDLADDSVTYAKLDPSVVPLGQVISWYRVSAGISVPDGWEICDGRAWSGITNKMGVSEASWTSGNIPDLRNKFVLGAATSGTGSGTSTPPDIGQTGGSQTINLSHTHTVGSHTHSVPAHAHSIGADGSHRHRWQTTVWDGSDNPVGSTFTDGAQRTTAVPSAAGSRQSFYVPDLNRNQFYGDNVSAPMETVGTHSHGGVTGNSSGVTSGAASPTTDAQLSATQDNRPAYVGLLFIMRVR